MNLDTKEIILYISKNGNDTWSGKIGTPNDTDTDGPLFSIEGAKDRIKEIRSQGILGLIKILINEGDYEVQHTIKFNKEDIGAQNTPIAFIGVGQVKLIGGIKLKNFCETTDKVVKLDLKAAGHSGLRFKELFYKGRRQQKARYPSYDENNPYGGGWLYAEGNIPDNQYNSGHVTKDSFICKDPNIKKWTEIQKVEVFIFPRYNWTNNIINIKSYDEHTGEVKLENPAKYEIYPGDRFYFQNVKEELSSPGEWYLDNDILYFYPPENIRASEVEVVVPVVENIIEINGGEKDNENLYAEKIDWRDSGIDLADEFTPFLKADLNKECGYISFEGVSIETCKGAGIVVRNAKNISFVAGTIRNTGGAGAIILNSMECTVEGCDIYDVGSHGVYVSGGIRSPFMGKYVNSNNIITNNYIHHIGVSYKSVAGVMLNGVGIKVTHNLIHDGPRWGIFSRGNNNEIAFNHIRHVNVETSDTGAINTCDRDFTMHGTKIEYNLIHDVLGYHCIDGVWHSPAFAFGIYLDDFTSGIEVIGNLTYNTPCAGFYLHSGKDNIIENNMFLETRDESIFILSWLEEVEYRHTGTKNQSLTCNVFKNNILSTKKENSAVYTISQHDIIDLPEKKCLFKNNLFWNYGKEVFLKVIEKDSDYGKKYSKISIDEWNSLGYDTQSIIDDPQFVDYDNRDYRLKSGSPALKLGFAQLPIDKMGPYKSDKRISWPIIEAEGVREKPMMVQNSI